MMSFLPRFFVLRRRMVLAWVFLFLFAGAVFLRVFASDVCSEISDLDQRAACYDREFSSTTRRLADIKAQKDSVSRKITQLASQIGGTQQEINSLQLEIDSMNKALGEVDTTISQKRSQLEEKILTRNRLIRNHAINSTYSSFDLLWGPALGQSPLPTSESLQPVGFFHFTSIQNAMQRSATNDVTKLIALLNTDIANFEADRAELAVLKTDLERAQASLVRLRNNLGFVRNQETQNLGNLTATEKSFQQRLSEISQKQQEVLALKASLESSTVGEYVMSDAHVPAAPFSPAFGLFSYGAYTHYKGMSQYGAKARAEEGQSAAAIIAHYYGQAVIPEPAFSATVQVQGHGELDFQYYLYGLAEMPDSWHMEALKAQAIAGRTYAYRYVRAGTPICTTQSCQVFSRAKADNVSARWKQAVDETAGLIIAGNSHAMYSSTAGGFLDDSGWDVKSGTNWPEGAYDNIARSPWFYWPWFSRSMQFTSDKCGRTHPWLTSAEMADVLNAWVVFKQGSTEQRARISPVTTSCWGGNPYSLAELAAVAAELGQSFTSVSSASATVAANGRTSSISFVTNTGALTIDGQEFRNVFNLRAPGYVAIKSRLYDVRVR